MCHRILQSCLFLPHWCVDRTSTRRRKRAEATLWRFRSQLMSRGVGMHVPKRASSSSTGSMTLPKPHKGRSQALLQVLFWSRTVFAGEPDSYTPLLSHLGEHSLLMPIHAGFAGGITAQRSTTYCNHGGECWNPSQRLYHTHPHSESELQLIVLYYCTVCGSNPVSAKKRQSQDSERSKRFTLCEQGDTASERLSGQRRVTRVTRDPVECTLSPVRMYCRRAENGLHEVGTVARQGDRRIDVSGLRT